ncbi:AbrB family transcriptional regulator [Ignicoccus islandicus DSM 13165]|uniref:AbrB family transcriptional regulator n=1 Tax=Ignicoccus islandicus DSM 13165 TaxID=940295 RepID=A0A0U3E979_9CREN|nr:ACT domain-containing protein [Ignicoccus islandicus]ALU11886.1 AbrB family transcriptional regulator [Ignicoccus islandicus DSM 13165]
MRIIEILKVDGKGRVTIPRTVRDALNIIEGGYVIMIADLNKNEILLTPTSGSGGKLLEIRILFNDERGKLAEISEALAEMNVDQITTNCRTMRKGEVAECTIVVEASNEMDESEIERKISGIKGVKEVLVVPIQGH